MQSSDLSAFGSEPMIAALAWVLTYVVHSTVLLGGTWVLLRALSRVSDRVRDALWKLALVGGVATATVQVGLGWQPFGGSLLLLAPAETTAPETTAADAPETTRRVPERHAPGLLPAEGPRPSAPVATEEPARDRKRTSFPAHLVSNEPAGVPFAGRAELPGVRRSSPSRASSDTPATPAKSVRPMIPEQRASRPEPVATAAAPPAGTPPTAETAATRVTASPWLLVGWVGGTLLGALALVLALVRLRRALLRRRPLESGPLAEVFADLLRRSGTRRRVRLSTSTELAAPITFGLWRSEICVPVRALTDLDAEQQEAMLAHELAHAVRRDPSWQLVSKVLVAVFFFQPLNRVARKRLLDIAEYLSDDWAVAHTGRELPLASCLTEVARWIVGDRPLLAPGMADGSRLGVRVRRLLDADRRRTGRTGSRGPRVALASAGLAAFAGFVPGVAAAPVSGEPERALDGDLDVRHAALEAVSARRGARDSALEPIAPPLDAFALAADPAPVARSLVGAVQHALSTLDAEIDDLVNETGSLRTAIGGLSDATDLEEIVVMIEGRIDRLRNQREALAKELPRLSGLLEDEGPRSENDNANSSPRRVSR